ncbi:MAG: tail fiber domain-containing protein [Bacteroidota bacterium]
MKKSFLFSCALIFSVISIKAQVGINSTNTPPNASAMLDVSSSNKGILIPRIGSTTAIGSPAPGLLFYNTSTNLFNYYNGSAWIPLTTAASSVGWLLSGSNLINNNSGNIGIGTANPTNKLHVKQNVTNAAIEWQHESLNDMWTVGIGTNTLNCRFEFNDALRGQISSVDGSFIAGSDFQLKQEIEPISDLLQKTMQLKPSKYFYKSSRNIAKNKSIGFIAQDVEKIFPEIVYDSDDGLKGLNYSAFGVIAVKAIQEQQQIINQLQDKLLEQGKNNLKLEARLLKLETAFSLLSGK